MARKLKTYQTSLGFFDQAIAAHAKAALAALGADSNLSHQSAAKHKNNNIAISRPPRQSRTHNITHTTPRLKRFRRSHAENARWEKQKHKLDLAVRRARK